MRANASARGMAVGQAFCIVRATQGPPMHTLMRVARLLVVLGALGAHDLAFGQLYRCQDGGRTIYSDRPCATGVKVKKLAPSGGPTPEDQARAANARAASVGRAARDRSPAANRGSSDSRRPAAPLVANSEVADDSRREMVHSRSGWEYKTKGQLRVEQAVRDGTPVQRTGAAWENERPLSGAGAGWSKADRFTAAQTKGAALRAADEHAAEARRAEEESSRKKRAMPIVNGQSLSPVAGGAVEPATGTFHSEAAGGYVNSRSGKFTPSP